MHFNQHIQSFSFPQWIWRNRKIFWTATGVMLAQFFIYKIVFPFPNFLPDSYSYIEAAVKHQDINKWPIGYSYFLRLFAFVTRSHTGIVWLQYLMIQVSSVYLIYTISCLLNVQKKLVNIILFASICNPLVLQVANLVSADALFTALSLIWLSQILWILFKTHFHLLIIHSVILVLVFTVRYNALYYPIISLAVVFICKTPNWKKLSTLVILVVLLSAFIGYTQYHYDKQTGQAQFSPFSGWQLASNALYAYSHISARHRIEQGYFYKDLHNITNRHMDSIQRLQQRPDVELGTYYLWDEHSPLKQNLTNFLVKDHNDYGFKYWSLMGIVYKNYGMWLIKNYPFSFLKYFVGPNLVNYYAPNIEFLGVYNMNQSTIQNIAVEWFMLKSNKVYYNSDSNLLRILDYTQPIFAIINLLFVFGIFTLYWLKGFTDASTAKRLIRWIILIWFTNLCFSILSSPVVLRYQLFPMLFIQPFIIWSFSKIIQQARSIPER